MLANKKVRVVEIGPEDKYAGSIRISSIVKVTDAGLHTCPSNRDFLTGMVIDQLGNYDYYYQFKVAELKKEE